MSWIHRILLADGSKPPIIALLPTHRTRTPMHLVVQPLQRTLDVRAGANLLEVLRENAIPLSYSCMAGRCGTCRCKVVDGDVMTSGQESKGPLANGDRYVLAC